MVPTGARLSDAYQRDSSSLHAGKRVEFAFAWGGRMRPPLHELLDQRAAVAVFFFWSNYYGCGYAVTWFQLQQADALRVAARFADRGRIHANDLAVVADQHDFGLFIHLRDADDLADPLGRLQVDDAFASAVGEAVFVGGGALAKSVLGDAQDQVALYGCIDRFRFAFDFSFCWCGRSGLQRRRHTDDVVALFQIDAPDAVSRAAHRTDVAFVEADRHAFVCGE